jgi:hypothetical protein
MWIDEPLLERAREINVPTRTTIRLEKEEI